MTGTLFSRLFALGAVGLSMALAWNDEAAPARWRPTAASAPPTAPYDTIELATPAPEAGLVREPALPDVVGRLARLEATDNPVAALQALQDALDLLAREVDLTRPGAGELLYGQVRALEQIAALLRPDAPARRRLAEDLLVVVGMRLQELIRLPHVLPRVKGFLLAALIGRGERLSDGERQFIARRLVWSPEADAPSLLRTVEALAGQPAAHPQLVRAALQLVRCEALIGEPAIDHAVRAAALRYLRARAQARPELPLAALARLVEESRQRRDQSR